MWTIENALRCALRINSGKIIFISRLSHSAECSKRYFHRRGCNRERQLPRSAALSQKAALQMPLAREYPFRLAASRQATFPKGTAFVVAIKFSAQPKGVPLGELAANAVSRLRG